MKVTEEPDLFTFFDEARSQAADAAIAQGDPLEFYLTQTKIAVSDVTQTYHRMQFGKSKVEDVRNWLARVAGYALKAWLASWKPQIAKGNLISTADAQRLMESITGKTYSRQAIAAMVTSQELKVVARKAVEKTGRPMNYFRRAAVLEAANRRLER